MICRVCHREDSKLGLCHLHQEVYQTIAENYDSWRKALNLSWKEYLSEIERNPLTGEWIKEVAKKLIEEEKTKNVQKS